MNTPRSLPPTAPARGSFPLDHDGACKKAADEFMLCVKKAGGAHHECRNLSKAYLSCRMNKGLMAEEDLNTLGFSDDTKVVPGADTDGASEKKEIIAGLSAARRKPGLIFGLGGTGTGQRGGGH